MAESVTVQAGDIVMVRRGQTYVAMVQRASASELVVMPLQSASPIASLQTQRLGELAILQRCSWLAPTRHGRSRPRRRALEP